MRKVTKQARSVENKLKGTARARCGARLNELQTLQDSTGNNKINTEEYY